MEYPLESGQRMLVKPNSFKEFADLSHTVVCLGKIQSGKNGIIAKRCSYVDEDHFTQYIDIPLFLMWRIADDEDLLEIHEIYVYSYSTKNNQF